MKAYRSMAQQTPSTIGVKKSKTHYNQMVRESAQDKSLKKRPDNKKYYMEMKTVRMTADSSCQKQCK